MCGLAVAFSKRGNKAGQVAYELYLKQKSRGQRGYGYVALKDRKVVAIRRSRNEDGIKSMIMKEDADAILFHHRLPTSTDNTLGTTHPILVSHESLEYDYYVAHNGIISNSHTLKEEHNKLGFVYTTEHSMYDTAIYLNGTKEHMDGMPSKFNDSESLAIEIARYLEEQSDEIGTTGSVAFWAIRVTKDTKEVDYIFYGKNYGRDLAMRNNNKWWSISSETGEDIDALKLYMFNTYDFSITEGELAIADKAEPIVRTYTDTRPAFGYSSQEYNYTTKYALVDKNYTYQEMRNSGHDGAEFDHVWVGCAMFYVPKIYAKEREARAKSVSVSLLPSADDDKPQYSEKSIARLEELAVEYAVADESAVEAEEMLADGCIDYNEYTKVFNKAQDDMQVAEELISCLGLPQSIVDEAMENAASLSNVN